MAKTFYFKFGSGDPRSHAGLSPTFVLFYDQNGSTLSGPAISTTGFTSGIYQFSYTPTLAIAFLIDGATTGLVSADRYITGSLDPVQMIDQTFGTTISALSSTLTTLIGTTADSYGSTSADPSTLFGYAKRLQENMEGNSTYNKSTNKWDIYTRGSSTLLIEKTLTDNSTQTTKT